MIVISCDSSSDQMQKFLTKPAKHLLGFALFCGIFALVEWRALVGTFALSLSNDEYTHILLILPISVALIFLEWRSLRITVSLSAGIGSALLVAAVLIACSTLGVSARLSSDVQLSISMFALVLSWIGAFVFCFGYRAARSVGFPLCFLFGLVPFPQFVLNVVVGFLQLCSAWIAHMLFAVFNVPVAQDGVVLVIPGLALQVAQECSSIRSSSMLLVTTMVLAQLLLRSPWRRAIVIGLAIPLSVAKNGLRIFTIAMLGTRVDPEYLTGKLHRQGGIVFFGIALIVVFALFWIFRRGEDSPFNGQPIPMRVKTTGG
ncbi:MAG: exosortase/archaeosortase family protein [Terracidiphilus sp.]